MEIQISDVLIGWLGKNTIVEIHSSTCRNVVKHVTILKMPVIQVRSI